MAASIEAMREQLTTSNTTISNLSVRLTTIESLLKSTQAENATLKEELAASALESTQLKAKLNHLEQHHRSWSVRVTGLNIPTADETDSNRVKHHLYEQLLKPILLGAVSKKILPTLPTESEIIERAHVLPSKNNKINPVIARFYCRDMRALIFKLKKVRPEGADWSRHQEQQRWGRAPEASPLVLPDLRRSDQGEFSEDEGHWR